MKKATKYILFAICSIAILTIAIFGEKADFGLGRNMEIMVNTMREISTNYVDSVSADDMMQNGAKGITSHLDPYTTYLSETEMEDFQRMTTGKYGGIGSLIRQDSDYVRIAEPYFGSPADKAGFQIGDKIIEVNGMDAKGKGSQWVSDNLKGEPNTTVKVKLRKLVDDCEVEYKLRRQRISIPSIPYTGFVADGVGYIRHSDFTDDCYDQFRSAILSLQKEGKLEKLILDYRNNGGGVMQSAVNIVSLFVPKGTKVLEMKGRNVATETYKTSYEPLLPNIPLVVLINGNSASASEIVAGSLQDLDRAVLIGQKSFGKGLVQTTIPVGYGAYVKMTTAKYYIPSGRCVQALRYNSEGKPEQLPDSLIHEFATKGGRKIYDGGGIMPDIKVEPEYISTFATVLYLVGSIDDYGDQYFKKHYADKIEPTTFSITDADYEDFCKMVLAGKPIPFHSESRNALESLKKSLKKEHYDNMEELITKIDTSLKDDTASNLQTFRKEIIESINGNIILRYAYSVGVIKSTLSTDATINKAIEILSDTKEMHHILTEADLTKK